jgi:hypothetical protein
MVGPGRQERHAVGWLIRRVVGDLEAEKITVEGDRAIHIGDHQMHVANLDLRMDNRGTHVGLLCVLISTAPPSRLL